MNKKEDLIIPQTPAGIEILFRTAAMHSDFTQPFGAFCAGISFAISHLFHEYQNEKPGTIIHFNMNASVLVTQMMMEKYEHMESSLSLKDPNTINNIKVSQAIMNIVALENSKNKKENH